MLRLTILLLLAGLHSSAAAATIDVGGRLINVPVPDDFVELTPAMSPYYEAMAAYVGPNNIRFLTLIRATDAEALLRGETIEIDRYINVETEKNLLTASISTDNFQELRELFNSQLEQIFAAAGEDIDDMLRKGNETLSESYGSDLEVEVGAVVPLPVHLDASDRVAFSSRVNVGASVGGQSSETDTIAGTTLVLHVQDKVLFVYAYGSDSDLEWTRQTAGRFADAIIGANPLSDGSREAREKPDALGINRSKYLDSALIGAVAAGLVALLAGLFRKRRRRDEN